MSRGLIMIIVGSLGVIFSVIYFFIVERKDRASIERQYNNEAKTAIELNSTYMNSTQRGTFKLKAENVSSTIIDDDNNRLASTLFNEIKQNNEETIMEETELEG